MYDDEAKIYKPWEIYWVLEGLQKLGKFDKEKQTFTKRDKNTIYPFPEVDKAAVFNTLNLMEEYLKSKKGPEELKNALSQSNFKQLYEYSLKKLYFSDKDKDNETKGIWKKYNQGSDYHIMRNDLQGKMTGWCIEAGENFAKEYLEQGDFYIYYTIDKEGNYTNPRIAIRTLGSTEIEEIRGILNDQNMEPEMLPILDEKLKEFPNKDEYLKKKHDMECLTLIEKKVNAGIELNAEELKFLYEIDDYIEGFGWGKDPRIEEIKSPRNIKSDLSLIFNCSENEIAVKKDEINENTRVFCGSLDLRSLANAESLVMPQRIEGSLDLDGLRSAEGLVLPQIIKGSLNLNDLTSAEGLVMPQSIGGDLNLVYLRSAEGLVLPQIIKGSLDLGGLRSAEGLVLPQIIGEDLTLIGLRSAEGLVLPQSIGGSLILNSLASAEGLVLPQRAENVELSSLTSAEGLVFPDELTYKIYLANGIVITPENVDEYRTSKKL